MKLIIEIQGDMTSDLSEALEEINRLIKDGMETGANSNETGKYQFYTYTHVEEEDEDDDSSR